MFLKAITSTLPIMKDLLILLGPGGAKAIVADSLLMKQQLLVNNRSRRRSLNLLPLDRFLLGFWSLFLCPRQLLRTAIIIRPSTLLKFHDALVKRKYRLLFPSIRRIKPGPKGPSRELVQAIVELKQRNPRFGCRRIAQQVAKTFAVDVDKDMVRRVLAKHYHPIPGGNGPSWLTFIGHAKDSLWSIDLFQCESILLKSHWVLVVLDQFTRRIIGFAVHPSSVDGAALCGMFNQTISGLDPPSYLSTDNDPLFKFYRWRANLQILGIDEIKTTPYTPISHPFVEQLTGTIRREYLDHTLFWNAIDLQRKLNDFKTYYNNYRTHSSLRGQSPCEFSSKTSRPKAMLNNFTWKNHCRGLFQTAIAA